jgi:hypothetical protein
MRKAIVTVLALFIACNTFSQAVSYDKIYKHAGDTIRAKVIRVDESVIAFKYPNEDVEQTIGKLAVEKIEYGSGRVEKISDRIDIEGKSDWEKVQIITDAASILGLKKGGEISGKTSGWINMNSQAGADSKATKHLKQSAAEANVPYVLLTADKNSSSWDGTSQGLKKGVMYSYD